MSSANRNWSGTEVFPSPATTSVRMRANERAPTSLGCYFPFSTIPCWQFCILLPKFLPVAKVALCFLREFWKEMQLQHEEPSQARLLFVSQRKNWVCFVRKIARMLPLLWPWHCWLLLFTLAGQCDYTQEVSLLNKWLLQGALPPLTIVPPPRVRISISNYCSCLLSPSLVVGKIFLCKLRRTGDKPEITAHLHLEIRSSRAQGGAILAKTQSGPCSLIQEGNTFSLLKRTFVITDRCFLPSPGGIHTLAPVTPS